MSNLTTKEIEAKLKYIEDPNDPFLKECEQDHRKTVQTIVKRWFKQYEQKEHLINEFERMSIYENQLRKQGYKHIAGIDEVGRGPLAGPVVAACVILPEDFVLLGLTDSKKISEQKREEFFEVIQEKALDIGIGFASAEEIDQWNIYEATKIAMKRSLNDLKIYKPDYLLIDAMKLSINIPEKSIVKGDANSISIAASSIVAKVTRDRYMKKLSEKYPHYGFENHMGYGTKHHLDALKIYGVTKEHRKSFTPVKNILLNPNGDKHGTE